MNNRVLFKHGNKHKAASTTHFTLIIIAVISIILIVCLTLYFKSLILNSSKSVAKQQAKVEVVGCDRLRVSDVWTQTFPKLLTESAIRLLNINNDDDLDIVIGFGTGADGYEVPDIVCDVYFEGIRPCLGGILAIDGRSGLELWRHYSHHEIFALTCGQDLNDDGSEDCVGGGRAGVLEAVNGRNGHLIWRMDSQEATNDIMNFYTPQFVMDLDGDSIVEVLVSHGGDPLADPGSKFRLSGRLLVISGRSGRVIQWAGVPDHRETYYSIQQVQHPDGSGLVIFGSGGETHPGALWVINFNDLIKGDTRKARCFYRDNSKGLMTPPVLVDINNDQVEDVVIATFNSLVIAFDGNTFQQLWNYTIPSSESYSTPSVGFFNDDHIPDFLVKFQIGPGFPLYYYSETNILDGGNGQPLLAEAVRDTVGAQASGLTISMEGKGNDIFLYWTADCKGHEGEQNRFQFVKDTNIHEQSRSDFCLLRFGSQMVSKIYALGRRFQPPGVTIYNSESRKSLEFANAEDTEALGRHYLLNHPNARYGGPPPSTVKRSTRLKRHVGPHDMDGVQRLISTGTLAPLLRSTPDDLQSIDHVFATYWFFPAKTKAILPEDRDCIQRKMALEVQRFQPHSKYKGMDHDAYEDAVTQECIEANRHLSSVVANRTYESQSEYDPFKIHMGQMTVYRIRITCACSSLDNATQRCANVLPFHKQMWASYMGTHGDSHANYYVNH